jgi:hypothetical protein
MRTNGPMLTVPRVPMPANANPLGGCDSYVDRVERHRKNSWTSLRQSWWPIGACGSLSIEQRFRNLGAKRSS